MAESISHFSRAGAQKRLDRRLFLRRALALGVGAGMASSLLAACAPAASPAPAAKAPAQGQPAKAEGGKPDANALDRIVEDAKKEGEVSLIEAVSKPETIDSVGRGFRQKWSLPDSFKIDHTVKTTAEVANGVITEIKASKVTFDIAWVVGVDLFKTAKQANELMAYEPTEWTSQFKPSADRMQLESDLPYYYPVQFYTFQPVWNRKKITKDITSWKDILDLGPEVKGRIIVGDVRNSASHLESYMGLRTVMEPSYWQQIKELYSPTLIFRIDEIIQKIVAGEADITTAASNGRPYQWWQQDKSLEFGIGNPKEGLTPLPAHMGILAKAPHPNAAKLMVEYLLSQESMQNWVNRELQWPLRSDYKVEGDITPYMKKADQVTWVSLPWAKIGKEERDEKRNEFRQIYGG